MKNKLVSAIELFKNGTNNLKNRINLEHTLINLEKYNSLNTVLENDSFLVEYNKDNNSFELKTSFSNIPIDINFINEMNVLIKLVDEMNCLIK